MPQSNPPVSITLSRRLAEVADSYRNFPEVFLVAPRVFPKPVPQFPDEPVTGFPTIEAANNYFTQKGLSENDWGIFGPFLITENEVPIKWDIEWGRQEVERATITVRFKNETQEEIELHEGTDAIFLNLSSFDKFAMPYYTQLYGVGYALKLRNYILEEYVKRAENGKKLMAIKHFRTKSQTQIKDDNTFNVG